MNGVVTSVSTRYVLVTPAHNEERLIERAIESVLKQTVPPMRYVIVNDGSSDSTATIAERYSKIDATVTVLHIPHGGRRCFSNKVRAFHAGFAAIKHMQFEFVGNLDADISLAPDYFERLLSEFAHDPRLGIGGGRVHTLRNGRFVGQSVAADSVAGGVQLFRRDCYEDIGGYLPLPYGGIDAAAEIMARARSWRTRTFPALQAFEHRQTGWAVSNAVAGRMTEGKRFYTLGYGMLFFVARCLRHCMDSPPLYGSAVAFAGYCQSLLRREPLALPVETVRYLRREQRGKLWRLCKSPRSIAARWPARVTA
ncbi:MAG TPA: glycosyltransferase family A protein [Verrucomicrobiota bacterium]|jgi:glycosyltransferase involved in cell wall biosynthesis|nr:glycosyltransferase family A protein [Verrucomicrobiota bacterium]OQC66504.1 MAG: Poly-beta-1,6-N-acetyl-D-glucosamine synthase [Verrucomicrobia bacterium ADurb.Bin006]HPW15158.1 glycosyltransferase family A protein [Nitrospira sp.]NMD20627.1 glycosyltransferase family 2 protein [Verrucomicrobiota bacterium]HOF46845.1 glycosyltransferase family A protein [Verrucomicrobiota bacterium]